MQKVKELGEIRKHIREAMEKSVGEIEKHIVDVLEKSIFSLLEKAQEEMKKLPREKRTPFAELVVKQCIKGADAESDDVILLNNYGVEILKIASLLSESDKTKLLMKSLDKWFSLSKNDYTSWHLIHRIFFAKILESGLPEDKRAQVEEKIKEMKKKL